MNTSFPKTEKNDCSQPFYGVIKWRKICGSMEINELIFSRRR